MKSFLIIPMGGEGKRFIKKGYKTYKSFLPIDKSKNIFDGIKNNFDISTHVIVLGSSKIIEKYFKHKKNCSFIKIVKHKKGPLHSIFLGLREINSIIGKCENIFISYTDINWQWKKCDIKKIIKNKACVITHKGFHPHLEVDAKSDFCKINNRQIVKISEKITNVKDYKNDNLAIGCYFFKNINYINDFYKKNYFNKLKKKKEFYLLTLINYLIKKGIKVKNYNIKLFVHLGIPDQYEDYIDWRNRFKKKFKKVELKNKSSFMLMCGKGNRVKELNQKKPFLKVEGKEFYKVIFEKFNTKDNHIITTKNYFSKLDKNKFNIYKIQQTTSMIETIKYSNFLLRKYFKYFLLSCDCYGKINRKYFKKIIDTKKLDLIIFAFKKSYLNSSMNNSHTSIIFKKNKIKEILVKSNQIFPYGHAGFFWINSNKVFKFLDHFYLSREFKKIKNKREVVIDDYFRFLLKKKLIKIKCIKLNDYVHLGSVKEFCEYNYWKNYFNKC